MENDLQRLEDWVAPLLAQLQPAEVRQLTRTLAAELRRRQAARIAAQQNPDGSTYAPRIKPRPLKTKPLGPAARKRAAQTAMFAKLRTAKFLRTQGTADTATVQILGRAARIAAVHQYGLRDQVSPGGPTVQYPERVLLGFTEADLQMVPELLLKHLAK